MAITEAQAEERHSYIGSSDAASVCGLPSAFSTAYGVYCQKVWRLKFDVSEEMHIGTLMEPVIAELYSERTKQRVKEWPSLFHKTRTWQAANIDRLIEKPQGNRILELKNAGFGRDWGPYGSDVVPSMFYLQVQHQMDVVTDNDMAIDADVSDMAVLIGGNKFRIYEVQRSNNVIARMSDIEQEFWDRVCRKCPPPPDFKHSSTLELIKLVNPAPVDGKNKELTDAEASMIDMIQRCHEMRDAVKKAEKVQKELQARILHDMGDHSQYSLPSGQIVRRQKVRTKHGGHVTLNFKGFKSNGEPEADDSEDGDQL